MIKLLLAVIINLIALNTFAQNFVLDTTFNCNYNFNILNFQYGIRKGLLVPNNEILIYGDFDDPSFPFKENLMELLNNGTVKPNFTHFPRVLMNGINMLSPTEDNKYIFIHDYYDVYKIDANGTIIDSAWTSTLQNLINTYNFGIALPERIYYNHFIAGTDGLLLNYGNITTHYLIKLNLSGSLDTSFIHNADNSVDRIYEYNNSKLILQGRFSNYDGHPNKFLCRIDTIGNVDTTFNSVFDPNSLMFGGITECFFQPDGKIIVAGSFKLKNNPDTLGLIRLLDNGSLDSTFNNFNNIYDYGYVGGCNTICSSSNGGFLIGGFFTNYQNRPRNRIARIDHNGYLDTTAFNGYGIDSLGWSSPSQPDITCILRDSSALDQYYVMGTFQSYNNTLVNPIIRLTSVITGLNNLNINSAVEVYPNPCNGICAIKGNSKEIKKINVFNLSGIKILQQKEKEINIFAYPPGIYFINIEYVNGSMEYGKIIKI